MHSRPGATWLRPVVAGIVAWGIAAPIVAQANGRAPLTSGVVFRPDDARSMFVRTTFGLLISRDDGCSFRWVCEKAIGYGGEFDPKYAVAADGTIFATTFTGLRVSRDGGCTWVTATAETPATDPGHLDLWIDAIDIGPSGDVWVATAESAAPNNVYRSTDNGVTFQPRHLASPTIWWKSVEVAPSRPQRVYVSGYQVAGTPSARLYSSDNAGTTWTEHPLVGTVPGAPRMKFGSTPIVLVAAVDPKQPDTVLVTSLGANTPSGDVLYRSTDAGATFTEVLVTTDRIRDVVHAADASIYVATLAGGSFRSIDGGATFAPLEGTPQLGCLGQRGDGALLGCGANWQPDFTALARADAAGWQKVFRFVDLAGPLACPAGTTAHELCEPMWPALEKLLGAKGTTGCPLVPDPAPTTPASTPKAPSKPPRSGGCCDAGGSTPLGPGALAGSVWLLLAVRSRRRYSASRQLR